MTELYVAPSLIFCIKEFMVSLETKTAGISAKTSHWPAAVAPGDVVSSLEQHVLVDGFKLVFDLEKSRGSRFVDAATGREFNDLYGF